MHMRDSTHTSSSQQCCTLPSVKSLLLETELQQSRSNESQPTIKSHLGLFNHWIGSYPSQGNLYRCLSERPAVFSSPDLVLPLPNPSLISQHMSNQQPSCSENFQLSTRIVPQLGPVEDKVIEHALKLCQTAASSQHIHRLKPLMAVPEKSRLEPDSSSRRPSVGTTTSNDKHKQSEKQRRDQMAAYVQLSDTVRASKPPRMHFSCKICIEDMSSGESFWSPSMVPDIIAGVALGDKSKGTKNKSIAEGMMFQFHTVLHHHSEEIGELLDKVRADLMDLWRDKQLGKKDNSGESNRRDIDTKAKVYMDFLDKTRYVCELHGVSVCACGKHELLDWPTKIFEPLMSPRSSSSGVCSILGQKRSREATEEEEELEDNRRVGRRSTVSPEGVRSRL